MTVEVDTQPRVKRPKRGAGARQIGPLRMLDALLTAPSRQHSLRSCGASVGLRFSRALSLSSGRLHDEQRGRNSQGEAAFNLMTRDESPSIWLVCQMEGNFHWQK